MGQARNRGTRTERIAQSIENTRLEEEAAKQAAVDWWDALTDEEQQAELKAHREQKKGSEICELMSILAGMSHIHV